MRFSRRHFAAALFLLALTALFGCDRAPSTSTIKGTVTYQNKPVDYGAVVFIVDDKDRVQVMLESDGSYVASGVPYGTAKIEVYSRRAEQSRPAVHSKSVRKVEPAIETPKGVVIPKMYNDQETSGLKVVIDKSLVEYNIQLKDPE